MLIEKGDDKNNNVAGHPVEDHDSAEDEVANDDVKGGENDDVDQAWACTSTIRTSPASVSLLNFWTCRWPGTRAPGHNPDPRAHGHTGTRAQPRSTGTRAHGHTGKAHQGTNLNFLFRQFSFGQTKTKIQSKPHLSFEPQSHHSLTSKCVCLFCGVFSTRWPIVPKPAKKTLGKQE